MDEPEGHIVQEGWSHQYNYCSSNSKWSFSRHGEKEPSARKTTSRNKD